jgi:hypothetical protein
MTQSPTTGERVAAAIVAGVAMLGTVIVVLVILLAASPRGSVRRGTFAYLFEHHSALGWSCAIAVLMAVVYGLMWPARSASMFGHLWFTERPRNWWLSFGLWAAIAFTVAASIWAER